MTPRAEDFVFRPSDYPDAPGVYLMKDDSGKVIYVGKAISLKKRLYTYFRQMDKHTPKTRIMVSNIADIDLLLTSTEKEALLLEASLIKKHHPRYNIVLRDDKQYVLFRLDKKNAYPRLSMTRKVLRDGSVYFGPFTSSVAARATWKLLGKVFPLRKCSDGTFKNRVRPCLYHHIGQCWAPCTKDVDREAYRALVNRVELFLSGRTGEMLGRLEKEMRQASEALDFEKAAELRDQIQAVKKTVERQVAVLGRSLDRDVVALAPTSTGLGLGLLFIRQGRLLDQKTFHWPGLTLDEGPEVMESFLAQFYKSTRFIPPKLLLPMTPENDTLEEVISDRRQKPVHLAEPSTREEKELVELARRVAAGALDRSSEPEITELVQKSLKLPVMPDRIECVDVSHLGGKGMRAGMVVFLDGRREPEASRMYSFPELEGSGDDYAALAAWAGRRVESGPPWPDLVLIDGGKGQLAAVERGLDESGLSAEDRANCWQLASIAKGPSRRAGELEDRIFRPGRKNHMPLKPGSKELLFLQSVRDTAHRYVIGGQRKARKKAVFNSQLSSLPGIGPKTARLLWDRFGSLEAMVQAGPDELASMPGIGKKRARSLAEVLQRLSR